MRAAVIGTICALVLSGCGNPLDRMGRLSDIELSETDPVREALAAPEEINADQPVLSALIEDATVQAETTDEPSRPKRRGLLALLRRAPEPSVAETVLPSEETLPPETAEVTSEAVLADEAEDGVEIAAVDPAPEINSVKPRRGLLGLLSRRTQPEPEPALEAAAGTDVGLLDAGVLEPSGEAAVEPIQDMAQVEPRARTGLLGLLRAPKTKSQDTSDEASEAPIEAEAVVAPAEATVELASLVVEPDAEAAPTALAEPKPRKGLFARLGGSNRTPASKVRFGPDARDIAPGAPQAFSEIARVCDARGRDLGSKVEKAGRGKGYVLYDSAPGSTGQRPFYVTGFADGCPRQFTAALALFGAPALHEQLRYGRPSDSYPYSDTDKAYEKVKSSVCKVGKRKPCGSRIKELERDTVFISVYERFTDNGRWADILLHDGQVLATALKDL